MPPRKEIQVSKSPAEFFAENQAIAGFDNMGKSLYTTLRELVENALDACESIHVLPEISVVVEEMTLAEFNRIQGITKKLDKDVGLFENKKKSKEESRSKKEGYFRIKVRDNGCGMSHEAVPNLLGRVLSGSKYGVRQTRGKFGLGAKMALIWSKKSTGIPIRIQTSHRTSAEIPSHKTTCVLDIDIYKNCPRILEHKKSVNKQRWVGTEFEVVIAGNWTTYKARIVQYLQQLAIITPYAKLELQYANLADEKKNMNIRYDKRSEQMPPPAREVKHHPSSVNNLLISQLLERTKTKSLVKFLSTDLANVSPALAKRLLTELDFKETQSPSKLGDKEVTRLVQLLRSVQLFRAPDASCLSPLGEYNLNLGIQKVLEPDIIATARDKPCSYEGHPLLVEAAIALGGKQKEGISVIRFANRIPLLFEGGADVATRVALTKIKWTSYKIDMKRDKIGVFVSIVSTKVPFKGTGKEYIGDDIIEIQQSVKRALQSCCQQLRTHLTKKNALKDIRERKSRLQKYVPDVGRALFGLLEGMRKRRQEEEGPSGSSSSLSRKRMRVDPGEASEVMDMLENKELTEESIRVRLTEKIDSQGNEDSEHGNMKKQKQQPVPLFLVGLDLKSPQHDIDHPLFTFRPIRPVRT